MSKTKEYFNTLSIILLCTLAGFAAAEVGVKLNIYEDGLLAGDSVGAILTNLKQYGCVSFIFATYVYSEVMLWCLKKCISKAVQNKGDICLAGLIGALVNCIAGFIYGRYWYISPFMYRIIFSGYDYRQMYFTGSFGNVINEVFYFLGFTAILWLAVYIYSTAWKMTGKDSVRAAYKTVKVQWKQIRFLVQGALFFGWLIPLIYTEGSVFNSIWGDYIPLYAVHAAVLMLIVLSLLVVLLVTISKRNRYYNNAIQNKDKKIIAAVRESESDHISGLERIFFRNRLYMKRLEEYNIMLLPVELIPEYEAGIVIDMDEHKVSIHNMIDISVKNNDEYLNAVIKLSSYVEYRKQMESILEQIHLEQFNESNCLLEEISEFKAYIAKQYDEFLVFDYIIKWMEIINYMYAFSMISMQKKKISDIRYFKEQEGATFGTWNQIRMDLSKADRSLKEWFTNPELQNTTILEEFSEVWRMVTSRSYSFTENSLSELIKGMNELRNNTRGHGVFTFEISQEFNIKLLRILVFLICQMMENGFLNYSFENMEQLGWLVYKGEIPYFLYSVDGQYGEYIYNSFRDGSSITIPLTAKGQYI